MGLRDKVALLLIAIVFQIVCAECKPQLLTKNPFGRYVSNGGSEKNTVNNNLKSFYGASKKNTQEVFLTPNIYKTFNFPEVDYPSETSYIEPYRFNSGAVSTARTSSNKMCDPALLDSLKKEARKKRKHKKLVNGDISIQSQQRLYVVKTGAFPEVEYPLNAMDTWTPKYWNALPCMDELFTKQNSFVAQNQANAKLTNMNTFVKPTNTKPNKELYTAVIPKENKNNEVNSINHRNNKSRKLIAPVKKKLKLKNNDFFNTTIFNSSTGRQIRHKRVKTKASCKKLNVNIKKPDTSLKPPPESSKLLQTETPDSNKNNYTCLTDKNINLTCSCVQNYTSTVVGNTTIINDISNTDDGIVGNQILYPSSSTIDNVKVADPSQIAKLSSSEAKKLAKLVLEQINQVPNEDEHTEIIIPNFLTPTNMAVRDMLPINVPELSLEPKCYTSNNSNNKFENYLSQSHVSDLFELYHLVEKILGKIGLQQNNYDIYNISSTRLSTGMLTAKLMSPDSSISDKINDFTTEFISPDNYPLDYNNMDEPLSNYTVTEPLPFCPAPSIDQCTMYDPPEPNSSNNTVFTHMEIPNRSTSKVSNNSGPFKQRYINLRKLLNNSGFIVSKDIKTDQMLNNNSSEVLNNDKLSYNENFQKRTYNDTTNTKQNNMSAYTSLKDIPEYNNLADVLESKKYLEYDTVANLPKAETHNIDNDTMKDMTIKGTLKNILGNDTSLEKVPVSNIVSDMTGNDNLEEVPVNNILSDVHANGASEEVPTNNMFADMLDNDTLGKVLVNRTLFDMPDNGTLKEVPVNDTMSNIPSNDAIQEMPAYNIWSGMPDNDILEVLVNHTMPGIPSNDTLEEMPVKDTVPHSPKNNMSEEMPVNGTLSDMPNSDTLEEMPVKNTIPGMPDHNMLKKVPVNGTITDMTSDDTLEELSAYKIWSGLQDTESLEEVLENATFSDMADNDTLEEVLAYNVSSGMADKDVLEEVPVNNTLMDMAGNDTLEDVPAYNIWSSMPDNDALEEAPETDTLSDTASNDTLVELPAYNMWSSMPENDLIEDAPANDMPGNDTVEEMSVNNTSSDMFGNDTLEEMLVSDTLMDMPCNYTFEELLVNGILSDLPNNDTLEEAPVNETFSDMLGGDTLEEVPVNDKLSNMPGDDTLEEVPLNDTLSDMADIDYLGEMSVNDTLSGMPGEDSLDEVPVIETFSDMPGGDTLEEVPVNNTLSDMPSDDTLEEVLENDTLSDMPGDDTLEEMQIYGTLSDMPRNYNVEEWPVNDTLSKISDIDTLKEVLVNSALTGLPDNYVLKEVLPNDAMTSIPDNYALTDMATDGSMSDSNLKNKSNTIGTLTNTSDKDVDIISVISGDTKQAKIVMVDHESLDSIHTNLKPGIFKTGNLTPNMPDTNAKLGSNIYDVDANDSNTMSYSSKTDSFSELDIPVSTIISDILEKDIISVPIADELINIKPSITNTPLNILGSVKLNETDIDELLDIMIELLMADIKENMIPDTKALPNASDTPS